VRAVPEQDFMKAMMCFLVEFWDVGRQPQPPIKPMSEPYIDFEWPLAGWCIHLPQARLLPDSLTSPQALSTNAHVGYKKSDRDPRSALAMFH
jgi:hypothetical protein